MARIHVKNSFSSLQANKTARHVGNRRSLLLYP